MKSRITLRIGKMLEALTAPAEHRRPEGENGVTVSWRDEGRRREQPTGAGVSWPQDQG